MTTKNVDVQQRAVFGVSNELSEEELASVSGAAALNPGGLSNTAKVVHGVGFTAALAASTVGLYEVLKNKPKNFSSI